MDKNIQAQLDSFLYHSPFPWWEWHIPTNVVTVSPRKVENLGYNAKDFEGKGYQAYTDLLHKDDYERGMEAMRDLLEGRSPLYQVDYRMLAVDGSYHWYMERGAIIKRAESGAPEVVRGIVIDLGKHVEERGPVEELINLLRMAVPDKRSAETTLNVCSNCLQVQSGDRWIEITELLTDFIALPKSHAICPACINKLYPEIANELIAKIRLEKLNRMKDQFLGMAVHDMRSPLNLISLYSQLLTKEVTGPLNDEQKELVAKISESGNFLKNLIDDFLTTSVIESGDITIKRTRVTADELVQKSLSFIEVYAKKRKVSLVSQISDSLPVLRVDSQKMCQVLNNLLSNAVFYAPPQSDVIISVEQVKEQIIFSVEDSGKGLKTEEINRIFDPYERGETESNREGGIGLGLSIAKKITVAHGGTIWVESTPGEGARFSVALPVQ